MDFALKLNPRQLREYADRYAYPLNENIVIKATKDIQGRGYLTRSELQQVAEWKSPRSAGHIRKNSAEYITAVTAIPFQTNNVRLQIESLTLLDGVSWPTASVILHLYHKDPYPILDFRALWSLSIDVPTQYNFELWWNYTRICRHLADETTLICAHWTVHSGSILRKIKNLMLPPKDDTSDYMPTTNGMNTRCRVYPNFL